MVYAVTVCHMEPEIIKFSLDKFHKTSGYTPDDWVMIDNCWPINPKETRNQLNEIAEHNRINLVQMTQNIGGHGGFNAGVKYFEHKYKLKGDDLILLYDPDSNPVTNLWLAAMKVVMENSQLTNVSLMHEGVVKNRNWTYFKIAGHDIATDLMPEMYNVTIFRYSFLKKIKEFKGNNFYGGVETLNWSGMYNQGYLYYHREDFCPIPHPDIYNKWKHDHACGKYLDNFDKYLTKGQ